jgi:hypothetical protein
MSFGCLRRVAGLLVLLVLVFAAWLYRDAIRERIDALLGRQAAAVEAGPELADQAEAKLASLAADDGPDRIALSEAELQSLLEFRLAGFLPGYVLEPRVRMANDRIRLQGRVATEHLPRMRELGDVVAFLPDTADITAGGRVLSLDAGRAALYVDDITAARIPLPRRMIPIMLRRLGRDVDPAVPEDALAIPLPPGATGAYVRRDSLIFVGGSRRPAP